MWGGAISGGDDGVEEPRATRVEEFYVLDNVTMEWRPSEVLIDTNSGNWVFRMLQSYHFEPRLREGTYVYLIAFAAWTKALIFSKLCFPSTSTPLLKSTPSTLSAK